MSHQTYINFIEQLGKKPGAHAICEAAKKAFMAICESEEMPDGPENLISAVMKACSMTREDAIDALKSCAKEIHSWYDKGVDCSRQTGYGSDYYMEQLEGLGLTADYEMDFAEYCSNTYNGDYGRDAINRGNNCISEIKAYCSTCPEFDGHVHKGLESNERTVAFQFDNFIELYLKARETKSQEDQAAFFARRDEILERIQHIMADLERIDGVDSVERLNTMELTISGKKVLDITLNITLA